MPAGRIGGWNPDATKGDTNQVGIQAAHGNKTPFTGVVLYADARQPFQGIGEIHIGIVGNLFGGLDSLDIGSIALLFNC